MAIFLLATHNNCYAQNETDNWYFGNKAALNFSNCNPTVVNGSQINTVEGCATISDINGNLLFYTDGIKVWNKINLVMQNGTGLFGDPSSSQSGVIVPQPGNDSIYYIFCVGAEVGSRGLCYSIVNINHNGGLGEVITKNTIILTSANEKITAVRHFNKKDVWVITRQFESDKYFAWLLTAAGVATSPVISTSPNYIGSPINTSRGYLKPSTDGKKLVSAYEEFPFLEMSDFNDQTGAITNIIKIKSHPSTIPGLGVTGAYGVEFSPNNKLLYITTRIDFTNPCGTCASYNYYINQYNVSVFDSTAIENSVVLLDSGGTAINPGYEIYGALQLAKNGKIYAAQYDVNKLSVIANPDVTGTGCNFQKDAVNLGAGRSQLGFPTFIQSYFNPNYRTYDYTYSEDCNKNVSFMADTQFAYDSLRWNFDDPGSGANNVSVMANPTHTYSSNGIRNVQLYIFNQYGCINKVDTVNKQIMVGNKYFNLGNDTAICEKDSLLLNATVLNATSYQWSTGAVTPTIKVSQPAIYWCDVSFGGCVYRDSILLTNKLYPVVNLGNPTTLCEDNTLVLDATNINSTYLWQDASTTPTFLVTKAGKYFVTVNKLGCITKDTIDIIYELKPRFTLGPDKAICLGSPFILDPKISESVSYVWQDGSTNPTYQVTQQGNYTVTITNSCGSSIDDITITTAVCELYIPNSFTPNGDTKNDIFRVGYGENVVEFKMQIFNRYGQLIFTTANKNLGWDGKYKGKMQNADSYVWLIQYNTNTNKNLQNLQGTVLLLQ